MELSNLTANLAGKTRRGRLNGEDYLVAPLSMLVEGVLNGSQGPLLYPADEITKNVDAWNGMPIVVTHPTVNGIPVSARSPDILETFGIGYVFNATVKGKLVAEGWFNIEKTRKVDDRVLNALESGTPIELSTGLFTTNEPAEDGAVFNGKEYSFVARNYRPDHLAVLPDEVGACSLNDGCGVLVNQEGYKPTKAMMEEAERGLEWRKEYNRGGTEVGVARARDIKNGRSLSAQTVKRMKAYFDRHEVDKKSDDFSPSGSGYPSAGRIAWSLWGGDAGKTWAENIVKRMNEESTLNKDTKPGLLNRIMDAVGSVLSPTQNKLSYSDIQTQLMKQLNIASDSEFWVEDVYKTSVVYHRDGKLYQQNFTVGTNDVVTLSDDSPVEVIRKTNYVKVNNASNVASDVAPEVGSEDQERIPTGNNKEPEVNEDQKKTLIDDLVANCSCWSDDDREVLNSFSDEKLSKLSEHSKKVRKPSETPTQPTANSKPTEEPVKKQMTDEEWFASAPAGVRAAVTNAAKIEKRERETLISKLTANSEDDKKEALVATLNTKSLEDLELMASLIPAAPSSQEPNRKASWFGSVPAVQTNNSKQELDEDDLLIPPTINFAESA